MHYYHRTELISVIAYIITNFPDNKYNGETWTYQCRQEMACYPSQNVWSAVKKRVFTEPVLHYDMPITNFQLSLCLAFFSVRLDRILALPFFPCFLPPYSPFLSCGTRPKVDKKIQSSGDKPPRHSTYQLATRFRNLNIPRTKQLTLSPQ